ncbi:MAG: protein phosphatase 2C domain-containing protein, partial [Myxococcota bacterium]
MDHSWGYGSEQRLREENQDCYGVFELPHYTLAIVCDGMGGHVGGAQASSLAVRTIHDTLHEMQGRDIHEALQVAIEKTNLEIYEAARKNHRLMGMGTTVVVAVIANDTCFLAHVGDSRSYLVRRGQVQQLTRDHTMVNLFVDAELLSPEDAATHPEAHVLSRSLGVERQVEVEIAPPMQLEAGDIVFLCSDGVHGVVTDWELGGIEWGAPHQGVSHVLDIVGQRDGDDNATAVAVLMGTSFEDVATTALPEPRRFDEVGAGSGAGVTAVPHEEDRTYDSAAPVVEADATNYIVYEDQPPPQMHEAPAMPPRPPTQVAPTPGFSEG